MWRSAMLQRGKQPLSSGRLDEGNGLNLKPEKRVFYRLPQNLTAVLIF